MNCMFVAICTIAVFLAGSSSARPSPLLGLGQVINDLPVGHTGKVVNGLTRTLPVVGGSKGGLLKVRSSAIDSENSSLEPRGLIPGLGSIAPLQDLPLMDGGDELSGLTSALPILGGSGGGLLKVRRSVIDSEASSLEPRGMIPGLDSLSGMTGMIPGLGESSGGLPGVDGLTSMLPGIGGSDGGFLKTRRSIEPRGMIPGLDSLSGMTGMIPGLGESSGGLPGVDGLTSMLPGIGGSDGGFLKTRRSIEPRGMIPGLDSLSGMTGMIPGLGESSGGLPGVDGLTSMLPGIGGSDGGFFKVRRSHASSDDDSLVSLGLDTPVDESETGASTNATSHSHKSHKSHKSSGGLLDLSVLPNTLSDLSV